MELNFKGSTLYAALLFGLTFFFGFTPLYANSFTVGSKVFTENYILAEIIAQTMESEIKNRQRSESVDRKIGLGGTGIVYQALLAREIDVYPEYTGTISEEILKQPQLKNINDLKTALETKGLTISLPLGFNNTYAIATSRRFAEEHDLKNISDLKKVPRARFGISYEFAQRKDGYYAMLSHYKMKDFFVRRMEHSLAYEALAANKIDLMEIYSTDAKVKKLDLVVLEDDQKFFPDYFAVLLARSDFAEKNPDIWHRLRSLEGSISENKMIELNAEKEIARKSFAEIARSFLISLDGNHGAPETPPLDSAQYNRTAAPDTSRIWFRTKEHAFLVSLSLFAAVTLGIPLGLFASRSAWLTQLVLLVTGLIQTVPSLALLCFLIPVLGIGKPPAFIALFLYALLPIVRNTCVGIQNIDKRLIESAQTLGLVGFRLLRTIKIPLAFRTILAGIKTAAVINVGTATLAAFIGAGGYGAPIVTGLALNDVTLILRGAIPAALMALGVHIFFEILDRTFTPKGLQGLSQ